jgi:cell division protein FtsB
MKRNFLLFLGVLVSIILVVNSTKRILTFRATSMKVGEAQSRLEQLRKENEDLKKELEYKKSDQFTEGEIRNKLGLVKEGETVVIIPKEEDQPSSAKALEGKQKPNWEKWRDLFFGT